MSKKYVGSNKGLTKLIELIKTRFEQLSCDDLKSVSTEANQGLTDTEKSNARANIGLNNVDNTSDTNKPVSTAQATAIADAKKAGTDAQTAINNHTSNINNPHNITKTQVGLSDVDNTADINKPVSVAQQDAIDAAYANSNYYTDQRIAELINGAPTTLDTLKEIADAMAEQESIVEALDEAIGSKANENEFNSHVINKSNPHGVTKSQVGLGNVPNVSTNDQTPTYTESSSLTALTSGEKLSVVFGKIAKAISSLISHLSNKSNPHAVTKAQVGLGNVGNFKAVSTEANQGLTDTEKSNASANIGAAPSSHTHSNYLTGITKAMVTNALGYTPPTSDTNTWRPLGTTADTACAGNDSRLSNARPASDVYSWAKAKSKPTYNGTELKVGGSGTYKDSTVESAISTLNSNLGTKQNKIIIEDILIAKDRTINGNDANVFEVPNKDGYFSIALRPFVYGDWSDKYAAVGTWNNSRRFTIINISGTTYTWDIYCTVMHVPN